MSKLLHASVAAVLTLAVSTGQAQIVVDGSTATELSVRGSVTSIEGGARPGDGPHLFHSFQQFGIPEGQTAWFLAGPETANIIARVTGLETSVVDGTLRADANLYLLNRNGIRFGPSAWLELRGGFYASSANALRFDDHVVRTDLADDSFRSVLSVDSIRAFGFLPADAGPGAIELDRARLHQPAGQAIGLIGGDVEIRGGEGAFVSSRAGNVSIASVRDTGEVLLRTSDEQAAGLSQIALTGESAGSVRLLDDALVSASGIERLQAVGNQFRLPEDDAVSDLRVFIEPGSGNIVIRAAEVRVEDSELLSLTTGGSPGGNIDVEGSESVRIVRRERGTDVGLATRRVDSDEPGVAPAGDIRIRAGTFTLDGGAKLSATTEDAGAGGRIDVDARIARVGGLYSGPDAGIERSAIFTNAQGGGNAGVIAVRADELHLDDFGALVAESGAGASGSAGTIQINVERLTMTGNARVDSSIRGSGAGGNINIEASESILLSGGSDSDEFTGITSLGHASSSAPAGSIFLTAPEIELRERARLSARSDGAGDAGSIAVGESGSTRRIELSNASIVTDSVQRDGGNVDLRAEDWIRLRRSLVSASVGDGDGGNVTIDPEFVLLERSTIRAEAGAGRGGNISIRANQLIAGNSTISARAETGIDGEVVVTSPEESLIGELAALSDAFLDASALLRDRCAARGREDRGGFTHREITRLRLGPHAPLPVPDLETDSAGIAARVNALATGSAFSADELNSLIEQSTALPNSELKIRAGLQLAAHLASTGAAGRVRAAALLTKAAYAAAEIEDAVLLSYAWGELAQLYEDEHRYEEALELTRRGLTALQAVDQPEAQYPRHWQAARLLHALDREHAALAQYRAAAATVLRLRSAAIFESPLGPTFFKRTAEPVLKGLVDLLLQRAARTEQPEEREDLLLQVRSTLEELGASELQDYFQDECVAALRREAPESVAASAVIYPVMLSDRTELIVSFPGLVRSYVVPVPAAELTAELKHLRRTLQRRGSLEHRRPARRLYEWLIRPLRADLEQSGAETLIVVPRGPFRTVPLAALWDSETAQYLIEQYPVAVTAGLTLTDPKAIDSKQVKLLKAGLTEGVQGYPPLPGVRPELDSLEQIFGGDTLVDASFRTEAFREKLSREPFGIVHIASHAEFGGDAASAFVLTYDGRLSMNRLAELVALTSLRDEPLELLALSACETALGDERAALGLAGIAVKAGARSTLATLWRINDRSSAQLVSRFYEQLASGEISRAVALQRAQLGLLEDPKFKHPYHWAPFLLIGSWL